MLSLGFGAFLRRLADVASEYALWIFVANRFCICAPANVIVQLLEEKPLNK